MNTATLLGPAQQQQVREAVFRAGEAILGVYAADGVGLRLKADASPLTEADALSNAVLCRELRDVNEYPVLSEEGAEFGWPERRCWQTYWLIDPLDGTKEFLKRNGEFTVNVALVHMGRPVFGVVHAPALGVTYFATAGSGAYKQSGSGAPVAIQAAMPPVGGERPWRIVGSRSHRSEAFDAFLAGYPGAELVCMGSSLKLCLVAEGSADLYPRLGLTSEWDTAAAQAVAEAAGAEVVVHETGAPLTYNQKESLLNPFFVVRARTA